MIYNRRHSDNSALLRISYLKPMQNWSGNQVYFPEYIAQPSTEKDIVALVQRARGEGKTIRPIGSGHSFTAVCVTDQILVSLDNYQGVVSINAEANEVTIRAGTKLNTLGELLFQHGLAMENLGDIDSQSIAGTISTGTHGTGTAFGTISTQVTALRFVNGKGEVVICSNTEQPELLKAARVSLGLLGIITEVTLRCVPAYRLALNNAREPMATVLETLEERNASHRNFEFYWFPLTTMAWTKTSNVIMEAADQDGWLNRFVENVVENQVFGGLCQLSYRIPATTKMVASISAAAVPTIRKVQQSHRVYATKRLVRFNEMEYNIPAEALPEVSREVMRVANRREYNIHFPIEHRFVAKDDNYLSPAFGRDSAYIACHAYAKKDYRPYFKALEEIFLAYGGRPHWGKLHTLTINDVEDRYPMFPRFKEYLNQHDPDGVFLSPYFAKLFGVASGNTEKAS